MRFISLLFSISQIFVASYYFLYLATYILIFGPSCRLAYARETTAKLAKEGTIFCSKFTSSRSNNSSQLYITNVSLITTGRVCLCSRILHIGLQAYLVVIRLHVYYDAVMRFLGWEGTWYAATRIPILNSLLTSRHTAIIMQDIQSRIIKI